MKRFIVMAVFALVFITTSAQAADKGMYVSGNLGLTMLSDSDLSEGSINGEISFDPGIVIGGALGYDYGNIRAEGEITYRMSDMDEATIGFDPVFFPLCPCTGSIDGDVSALSFMANGYYDFPVANSSVAPYLGGGIGVANVSYDFAGIGDDSDLVFAYQLMAGIGFEINPSTTLTAGYTYFGTTDADFQGTKATVESHNFSLGARFMF
jgi:opacity protein-like surface antigen